VIGLRPAFTADMDRIHLNEIPESGTPQLLYHIEVLALSLAMKSNAAAASIYPTRTWMEAQSVLLSRFGSLPRRKERQIARQLALGGEQP
jgi:hypothetical protein